MNCEQLAFYEECVANDAVIAELRSKLSESGTGPMTPPLPHHSSPTGLVLPESPCDPPVTALTGSAPKPRRGKVPPNDHYTGDSVKAELDDWLPTLECVASRNSWLDGEVLIQLAEHLCGMALQKHSRMQ